MRTLLLILLLTSNAVGATYYIDFVGGSDSNAGTSSGAPFKHCPGDADATGTAASTTFVAGDTIRFKGGVEYVSISGLRYTNAGTAGTPITFDLTGASYGTGQAILTSTNNPITLFIFSGCTDILWNGGMITNVGGYREDDPIWSTTTPVTSGPNGTGFYIYRSTNFNIVNATFSEIGQWTNAAPMSGTTSVTGTGVNMEGCSNAVIAFCEFTRTHTGVKLKANTLTADVLIVSNNVHNFVNWGIDVNPSTGGRTERVQIAYNLFHDTREFDNNRWGGTGDSPHGNKIFFRTSGITSTWTNNSVHHNWFYDDDTGAVGGTSQLFISQGPSVDVYCNLFSGRSGEGDIYVGHTKSGVTFQQVRIFNNTIYTSSRVISTDTTTNPDVFVFANNVVYRNTTTRNNVAMLLGTNQLWRSASSFTDHNLFFANYSPATDYYIAYPGYYATFASWKSFTKMDSNSVVADPEFVYSSGLPSTWDLRPLAGSPLLDGGTNLTAIVGSGLTDYDGVALPTGTTPWPIGAFADTNEFTVDPLALSATVNSAGDTVTMVYNQTVFVGSGGSGGFTAGMTLGTVNLTYTGGSGTTTLTFSTSRTIYSGETGLALYTQPGDGIENEAGTDVATFSDLTVTNGSGQQQPAPSGASERAIRIKGIKNRP